MAHVILIHGRNANEESWGEVPERLRHLGHQVDPVRLPHHDTPASLDEVFGGKAEDPFAPVLMESYIRKIESRLPKDGTKATLIGHSMGGAVMSHAANQNVSGVERLIYVAAMLPDHLETAVSLLARAVTAPGYDSTAARNEFEAAGGDAIGSLVREPSPPQLFPFGRKAGFCDIPKFYVHTATDPLLPHALQMQMTGSYKMSGMHTLSGGHLPQFLDLENLMTALQSFITVDID
ncbi:MAG: alpha/beta fold hydrolase [Pseudomonadota bacterium]